MNETPTPTVDAAAFQKVWRRVMPEDRHDCPFTLDTPPDDSGDAHGQRPWDGPAVVQAAVTPAAPPAPLPQPPLTMPQVPAPAMAQAAPQACLGEGCRAALPALEEFMVQTHDAARIYRTLARRSGRGRGFLQNLAAAKERQVRRLATARFLISGEDFTFPPTVFPRMGSLPLALRERYQAEQNSALALLDAAQRTSDPCLLQLYRDLAAEDQSLAGQIRERLEGR